LHHLVVLAQFVEPKRIKENIDWSKRRKNMKKKLPGPDVIPNIDSRSTGVGGG
jgi:hypothetical protein